jgi:DNA mismatch repair ATPase MutS
MAVPILTGTTLGLLAAQVFGATTGSWWLSPLLAGVVISFAFAASVYRTFDTVSMSERTLRQHAAMFALVEQEQWTAPVLNEMAERLRRNEYASRMIFRLSRLAQWSELRRSAALLHFPIQALTLWDFHVLFGIERWRTQCGRHVRGWFDALGEIDALATLAAIRHDEPGWALPEVDYELTSIEARELGHPLIPAERRVGNDVTLGPPGTLLLVTGSNMSGKSTLLRTVGINMVLAHAGAPVRARRLRLSPLAIGATIRIQDSLQAGTSRFYTEIERLRRIVEHARGDTHLIFLLDELLHGTNSHDRALGGSAILRGLMRRGAIGLATTHDLALARIADDLAPDAANVHFRDELKDGRMMFDYKMHPGVSMRSNALALMIAVGLEVE